MYRLLRTASFRLTALYVAIFAVSAALLGTAVFLAARSALEQQMAARIETDMAYLTNEFRNGGLDRLLTTVMSRGRGPIALDYLVQDASGAHLAGEMPAIPGLQPGWTTVRIAMPRRITAARSAAGRWWRTLATACFSLSGIIWAGLARSRRP